MVSDGLHITELNPTKIHRFFFFFFFAWPSTCDFNLGVKLSLSLKSWPSNWNWDSWVESTSAEHCHCFLKTFSKTSMWTWNLEFQAPHWRYLQRHSLLLEVRTMWEVPWLGVSRLILVLPLTSFYDSRQIVSSLWSYHLFCKVSGPLPALVPSGTEGHLLYSSVVENNLTQALLVTDYKALDSCFHLRRGKGNHPTVSLAWRKESSNYLCLPWSFLWVGSSMEGGGGTGDSFSWERRNAVSCPENAEARMIVLHVCYILDIPPGSLEFAWVEFYLFMACTVFS